MLFSVFPITPAIDAGWPLAFTLILISTGFGFTFYLQIQPSASASSIPCEHDPLTDLRVTQPSYWPFWHPITANRCSIGTALLAESMASECLPWSCHGFNSESLGAGQEPCRRLLKALEKAWRYRSQPARLLAHEFGVQVADPGWLGQLWSSRNRRRHGLLHLRYRSTAAIRLSASASRRLRISLIRRIWWVHLRQ